MEGALAAFQLYSSGGAFEITPIYNTEQQSGKTFHAQRYVVPLVNNGKVYVSAATSGNGTVLVYGPCSEGPNGACATQPTLPN